MAEMDNIKTTRFNQEEDVHARKSSTKIHGITKVLKLAGFPVKTCSGSLKTDSSDSIRKQFKLLKDNNYSMIELLDKGDDNNQNTVDWLNANTHTKIVDSKSYEYSNGMKVFRILVDISSGM